MTVKVVEPEMLPDVALIEEVPTATPVASPLAVIVADAGVAELQVTLEVRFCVVPLLKVPVAVNCCVSPAAMDGLAGVTAMETRVAEVTVKVVEPEMDPEVALIEEVPAATAVARPVALMVAVAGVAELQVAVAVRFCVVPSLSVPVAVNCCVRPAAMDGLTGVTAMETRTGAVTVRVVEPKMFPEVAEMVDEPVVTAVASPALVIVATEEVPELHVTLPVRFCVLPSLKWPVAVNCCCSPLGRDGLTGVTVMEVRVGGALEVMVRSVEPQVEPAQALMVVDPAARPNAAPRLVMVATAGLELDQVTA